MTRLPVIFNKNYFFLAVTIFLTEVAIALFVKDNFVRPYLGDVLVVVLIYCFVRSFVRWPVLPLALGVLLFSFAIELLQYVRLVEILGLEESPVARTMIGTSFAWADLVAYTVGILLVVAAEGGWKRR